MRCLRLLLLLCLTIVATLPGLLAGEYRLTNGDIVRGTPVAFDDDGMVVRLDIGGFSSRIGWSKLTQESLQELSKNPSAAKLVEPFIDVPPAPKDKDKKNKEIKVKPVVRPERIAKPNFLASLVTPLGLAVLAVLLLANLYAAYQIALFRHRPPGMVCGLSLVLPVIAPAIFLSMPASESEELEPDTTATGGSGETAAAKSTSPLAKVSAAAAGGAGLSLAAQGEKAAGAGGSKEPQVYKRGEFTFNRRFFETKFPGFFRVMPADPDLVLVVQTAKEEIVAKRISRISMNDFHLQLAKGVNEVPVSFAEVIEVQTRKKDKA